MKCRFVYVDDGVEKLVGFTREELFGKSLLDFIDEADHPLLNRILQQRNHFEANFDITSLHVVTRDQKRIPASVVVSLNFIAGNPVNYQIIIDAGCCDEPVQRVEVQHTDYRQFVSRLLETDASSFSAEALDSLYQFLGDEQCLIYQVSGESIEPVYWRSSTPQNGIRHTKEPKALLQWVAISDEAYTFLNPDCARRAVEKSGVAPTEYIRKLQLGEETYLVRVLLDELTSVEEQRTAVAAVSQAVQLVERLAPESVVSGRSNDDAGNSVLNDLKSSLASAMRIATMLSKAKTESHK